MGLRRASFKEFATFTLLLLCVSGAIPALAQNTIKVPTDQPTIQSAINAAHTGDTVLVAPGTYYENIDFKGKGITVTSSDGAVKTIIDGRAAPAVGTVNFTSGELRTSIISNFTIQNGGIGTAASWASGGVYINNAAPTVLNNVITSNGCSNVTVLGRGALVQGNTISNALNNNYFRCPAQGTAVLVEGNTSVGPYTRTEVIGNIIENNTQGLCAGGITIAASEGTLVQSNVIRNNKSEACAGGIATNNTDAVSIVQNLVYGNSGAQIDNAGGIGVSAPFIGLTNFVGLIAGNTIFNNTMTGATLGESATELNLSGYTSRYIVVNNIIVGSSVTIPAVNCSVDYNSLNITPPVFDHNDIYNSSSHSMAYGGACPDQTGSYGNISADPRFNSPSSSDFHLLLSSSAIDAGNNSAPQMPSTDLDGVLRVQDATGKGYSIVDMGAYEVPASPEISPTTITLVPSTFTPAVCSGLALTASVNSTAGIPQGPVQLFIDQSPTPYATLNTDSNGRVTFTVQLTTPNVHSFIASYAGTPPFTPATSVNVYINATSSGPCPGLPTTTTLTVSPNPANALQPVTLTATVTGSGATIPTGTVTFYDGASPLFTAATLDPNGIASYVATTLTGGNHILKAIYNGNTTLASSTSPNVSETIQFLPSTTTLSISPSPSAALQPVTATVQVDPMTSAPYAPLLCLCTVTVTITGLPPNVAPSYTLPVHNGIATFNFGLGFSAGTYTFTAAFSGSAAFSPSKSVTVQDVVVQAPTAISLTASPNPVTQHQPVNLTAAITAPVSATVSTGLITFFDGATPIASAPFGSTGLTPVSQLSNTATVTISTSTLSAGTHLITASYAGSVNFLPATSAPLTLIIQPQDYTLTTPPALTIKTEHHLATTVTLTSIGSFTDFITLACTNLPAYGTCTFDKSTLQLLADGTATAKLTIDTDAVLYYAQSRHQPISPRRALTTLATLLPIGLLSLAATRRRRLPRLLTILFLLSTIPATLTLSGCSGKYPGSTAPGTYTIQITSSGATTGLTHTATINLTVTP
jgi:hypothetical protein